MLKDKDGHILKYINKPILGERENKFYEMLKTTDNPDLIKLRKFVPQHFGTSSLKIANQGELTKLLFITLICPCHQSEVTELSLIIMKK